MRNNLLFLLLFGLLSLSQTVYAQSPDWLWANSAGGSFPDKGYGITTDVNGNVLVTGSFRSSAITFGTTTLINTNTGDDIFVVKYDALGNVLWAKSAIGSANEVGQSVSTDESGNVLVTGYYNSPSITFGTTTLTNSGEQDIYVVKYDAAGNVLWAKSSGGLYDDRGASISTDASGNIFITGYFESASISFGTTTLTNANITKADIFIAKYDASGNELWAKSAGALAPDYGQSIAADLTGNVLVTGFFSSPSITFDTVTLTKISSDDIFVVKYDASGNVLWAKSAGGSAFDNAFGICTDAGGNVLVTGIFTSPILTFDAIALTHTGGSDIFVAKYDASGNVMWAKTAQGLNEERGESISTDNAGNVLLAGSFTSPTLKFGTITLTNQGSNDIYIVKYDVSGNVIWAKSVGGIKDDFGQSIATDANGNVLITGNFSSTPLSFGSITLNNGGISDLFVAKLDATTLGIDENSNNSSALIHPNPFNSSTTIQLKSAVSNGHIKVYNVNGKLVKEMINISGQTITIHRDKLANGLYFISLIEDGIVIVSRKILITD